MTYNVRLCLVLHNHQPVGNFDGVIEQAYQDSYLPFLDVFEGYDALRISLHTSGPLMTWLADKHPEYVRRVAALVAAGRIEIIGGPFYEPILPMLPSRDRVGQIRRYTSYLNETFDTDVQGMWMPERVWESPLTTDIARAGIAYTVLDDYHFRAAGWSEEELFGYFVTEDDGSMLRIFPGSERLRYLIPFAAPEKTIEYAKTVAAEQPDAVLVCDLGRAQDVKALVEELERRHATPPSVEASSLVALSDQLARWLKLNALPLWATLGVDVDGAFAEALDDDGGQVGDFRRARVQARQAYVYSLASSWGWGEGYAALVERGLARFAVTNRRDDGLYRTQVTRAGAVLDDTASLYDQAFVLLATATAVEAGLDADRSRRTAAEVQTALSSLALPQGGWREPVGHPFQANAHMHLLEAALAWEALEPDGAWPAIADAIVGLARARFIDAEGGFLREFFAEDWLPAEGEAGRLVEPGHQFEWAWLLTRWGRLRGDAWAMEAARQLFACGECGLDAGRGVAIDELDDALRARSRRARLWPQTEWLKAALILAEEAEGEERKRLIDSASSALRGLNLYLTPAGLWHDKLDRDGVFDSDPAPASSLYHIVAACRQLRETLAVLPLSELEGRRC